MKLTAGDPEVSMHSALTRALVVIVLTEGCAMAPPRTRELRLSAHDNMMQEGKAKGGTASSAHEYFLGRFSCSYMYMFLPIPGVDSLVCSLQGMPNRIARQFIIFNI